MLNLIISISVLIFVQQQAICALPSSFRVKISRFDSNGDLVRRISALERYANENDDGHIEILHDQHTESEQDSTSSFYYRSFKSRQGESKSSVWLKILQKKCYNSDQKDLDLELYGSKLPSILGINLDQGGAARLLKLLEQSRSSGSIFSQISRWLKPSKSIKSDKPVELTLENGQGQLFMLVTHKYRTGSLPIRLELAFKLQTESFDILVDYHDLGQVPVIGKTESQNYIVFPTSLGCDGVLNDLTFYKEELSDFSKTINYVNFGARLSITGESGEETTMRFVFDTRNELLRRDMYHESTIYDFKRDIKYHFSVNEEDSQCVRSSWRNMQEISRLSFIDIDKLTFLGTSIFRNRLVDIYEDAQQDRLPFWLFPKQTAQIQQLNDLQGRVSIVYYFTSKNDDSAANIPLGDLVHIKLQMRNPSGNVVLLFKELEIFDFAWNQPQKVQELMSLVTSGCSGVRVKRQTTHIVSVLEPLNGTRDLAMEDLWPNHVERDEAIIKSLITRFNLQRTHIDYLQSRRIGLAIPPTVELQFSVSQLELSEVECTSLGRGHFLVFDSIQKLGALSFEDCVWMAHQYGQRKTTEVVFAHDPLKSLCLIDRRLKWRKLQSHETHLTDNSIGLESSLNYLPYEHGKHQMYTLEYKGTLQADHQQISWLKPKKSLELVGSDLNIPFNSDAKPVQYIIKHIKLDGHLANTEDLLSGTQKSISGLGFVQTGDNDKLVKNFDHFITEPICRSQCLMDKWCQSYSFCELSFKSECSLSSLDINQQDLRYLLTSFVIDKQSSSGAPQINVKPNERISVRLNKRCSVRAKPYIQLFDKSYQIKVDIKEESDKAITVQSENDCAKLCFDHNLEYLNGVVNLKHDLDAIREDLMSIAPNKEQSLENNREFLDTLTLKMDWHEEFAKNFCHYFFFGTKNLEKKSTNYCILSESAKPLGTQMGKEDDDLYDLYRFQFIHLYEKQTGYKLHGVAGDSNVSANLTNFISLHLAGQNNQLVLAMDSPEYCARACTLQTHGPRPSCASFDFVYERLGNQSPGRKYCLLNTQSLHDLQRRRTENAEKGASIIHQITGNTSDYTLYWHYEPREKISMTPDTTKRDTNILALLSTAPHDMKMVAYKETARPIQLQCRLALVLILMFSWVSGLILGVRVADYSLSRKDDDITLKNRMIRMVHRLSGASISHMAEKEVRFS